MKTILCGLLVLCCTIAHAQIMPIFTFGGGGSGGGVAGVSSWNGQTGTVTYSPSFSDLSGKVVYSMLDATLQDSLARKANKSDTNTFIVTPTVMKAQGYLIANQSIIWTGSGDVSGTASGQTNISPTLTIGAGKIIYSMLIQALKDSLTAKANKLDTTTYIFTKSDGAGKLGLHATADAAASLSAQYIDWNASSGGSSIANKPSALPPNGNAGGDLTGSYPNPTIGAGKVTNADLAGTISILKLNISGTPNGSKFLRDDSTWATPSGGSSLTHSQVQDSLNANSPITLTKVVKHDTIGSRTDTVLVDTSGFQATGRLRLIPRNGKNSVVLTTVSDTNNVGLFAGFVGVGFHPHTAFININGYNNTGTGVGAGGIEQFIMANESAHWRMGRIDSSGANEHSIFEYGSDAGSGASDFFSWSVPSIRIYGNAYSSTAPAFITMGTSPSPNLTIQAGTDGSDNVDGGDIQLLAGTSGGGNGTERAGDFYGMGGKPDPSGLNDTGNVYLGFDGTTENGYISFGSSRLLISAMAGNWANSIPFVDANKLMSPLANVAAGSLLASQGTTSAVAWSSSPTLATSLTTPLIIGGTTTTSPLTLRSTSGSGTTAADIIFQTGNNGATEVVRMLNSGNVGIGNKNPGDLFSVGVNKFAINSSGIIDSMGGIKTVSNGTGGIYAQSSDTAKTANISATTLYAVPASGAGTYRITATIELTTAASISSTMPTVQIVFTSAQTSTVITEDVTPVGAGVGQGQTGALTANTVGLSQSGVIAVDAKASTNIQYQTAGYTSNTAGMKYAVKIKLEKI